MKTPPPFDRDDISETLMYACANTAGQHAHYINNVTEELEAVLKDWDNVSPEALAELVHRLQRAAGHADVLAGIYEPMNKSLQAIAQQLAEVQK